MRAVLVILLVHGLVPGLAELGEAAVSGHCARAGLAQAAPGHGDLGGDGSEHGCGTTQHHCTCCPSQEMAPQDSIAVALGAPVARPASSDEDPLAARAPARPFRPPIS